MELVYCNCKKCDCTICLFVNLWTQIGKSYFSPIIDPDDPVIRPDGDVRAGEKGTLVEECDLQDIICGRCSNVVGLKCVETPVNHVLHENQILLRLASVELLSRDGQEVEFTTKRVLDVKEPSRVSGGGSAETSPKGAFNGPGFPEVVDIIQLQADLEEQREDINRIDSNGFKILSALDTRVARIEESTNKLKNTLEGARRDIGGVQEDLTSLKDQVNGMKRANEQNAPLTALEEKINSTNKTLNEVRKEVGDLQQSLHKEFSGIKSELRQQKQNIESIRTDIEGRVSARDHAKDMSAIRTEMSQMRRHMDEMRSKASDQRRVSAPFPSKELDILASNIAKIGNRASQVETLQMELEILKGRVERAEAGRQSPDDRQVEPRDLPSYIDGLTGRRKRTSSVGIPQEINSASKRPAFSSAYSDNPALGYDIPTTKWTGASSTPTAREVDQTYDIDTGVRLTRSGKVDKRTQRTRKSTNGKKG